MSAVKESLPFALTQAQEKSLQEILTDMKSDRHMNRLLQGDVGSGKTVVAGLAMFAAVTAGYQAALMVPTEILAEQHFESLKGLFPDLKLALLTGSLKVAEKREVLETMLNPARHNRLPPCWHLVDNGNIHIAKGCDGQRSRNGSRCHHENVRIVAFFP